MEASSAATSTTTPPAAVSNGPHPTCSSSSSAHESTCTCIGTADVPSTTNDTPPMDLSDDPILDHKHDDEEDGYTDHGGNNNDDDDDVDAIFIPTTTFADIVGHGAVKLRMQELLLPLCLPPTVAQSIWTGIRSLPASMLLYGPPGCGKTKLAQALAGQAQAAFLSIAPSAVLSKFVGESERALKDLFVLAEQQAMRIESQTAVVFLDEIDALGAARSSSSPNDTAADASGRRLLAELLLQLTQVQQQQQQHHSKILVVAATNRPQDCDEALLRRFGIRIHVGLPTPKQRAALMQQSLQGIAHVLTSQQLHYLTTVATHNFSGSDLECICREAAMAPIRQGIRQVAKRQKVEYNKQGSSNNKKRKGDGTCIHQAGGDVSGPEAETSSSTPTAVVPSTATDNDDWVQHFANLRPVNYQDFVAAIEFFLGNQTSEGVVDPYHPPPPPAMMDMQAHSAHAHPHHHPQPQHVNRYSPGRPPSGSQHHPNMHPAAMLPASSAGCHYDTSSDEEDDHHHLSAHPPRQG